MARNASAKAEPVTITPKALAEELEMSPKALRSYLRRNFARDLEAKNTSWAIDEDTADAVRAHFSDEGDDDEE